MVFYLFAMGGKKTSKQGELCNFSVRARCTTFTNDCDIAVCYSLFVVAGIASIHSPLPTSVSIFSFIDLTTLAIVLLSASSKKLTKMLWPVFKAHKRPIRHWERSVCHFDWVWKENQIELKVDQTYMHINVYI